MNDAAETEVSPDDRGLRVPPQECLHLREVHRLGVGLRKRHVEVVVEDDDETRFGGEVEDPIEGRIGQAGGFADDLRGHELLVDTELADPGEDTGKRLQYSPDVIDAVHVGRVEPGDHRIEPRLVRFGQPSIDARNVGVGERVVVEGGVGVQVVGWREVARVRIGPLLLQRNPEQRRAADTCAHDAQEGCRIDALLDVVRQVKVGVVEPGRGTLTTRMERAGLNPEDGQQRHRGGDGDSLCGTDRGFARHVPSDQKFISRLMWNTGPLAPTG
jgi:hypothetical protein